MPCLYGAVTLYSGTFQILPVQHLAIMQALQPRPCRNTIGLGCSAFARHYLRNHSCFLFLQVLRCFSSLRWPVVNKLTGCPIRRSSDQWLCAPSRSFSQLITSFLASESLGIHYAPFSTFFFVSAVIADSGRLFLFCSMSKIVFRIVFRNSRHGWTRTSDLYIISVAL